MPVSSNVSQQPKNSANSFASSKACLRNHVSASSSQSRTNPRVTLRTLTLMNRNLEKVVEWPSTSTPARPLTDGKVLTALCASTWSAPASRTHKPTTQRCRLPSAESARFGCTLNGKLVGASPKGASCAHSFGTVQCSQLAHIARRALLANQSLNRTFCCGRPLAFISFSAKRQPPQNAG